MTTDVETQKAKHETDKAERDAFMDKREKFILGKQSATKSNAKIFKKPKKSTLEKNQAAAST